jgi:hypothetical protein
MADKAAEGRASDEEYAPRCDRWMSLRESTHHVIGCLLIATLASRLPPQTKGRIAHAFVPSLIKKIVFSITCVMKTLLLPPDSASQASYAGARWCLWGIARGDRQDGPRGTLREPRHVELVRNPRRYESTHVSYHTLEHMAFSHWLGTWVMMYITDRLALGSGTREAFDPQFDTPRELHSDSFIS